MTPYDKTISPRTDRSPPSQPFHLREPTHLSVSQECLHPLQVSVTYVTLVTVYSECLHPLQPAPTKIRSFVCAKVFRRDEIASHLTAVHQTIVPGMNSSWLQIRWVTHFQRRPEKTCRCPLAWLGCPWASTRQAPLSKEVSCHRLSIENMIIQVTPRSNSSASSFLARMIVFLCGKWRKKYRRETKKGEATNKKQKI